MRRMSWLTVLALAVPSLLAPSAASAQKAASSTAGKAKLDDPTIVAIFDAANTADMETGQLAMKYGSTKEIRDFGATLVHDHKAVRQQGRDLAAKLGVKPTPPADKQADKDHAAAMAHLRPLHGAEFDRAFLAHEVAYHKAVIDAIQTTLLPAIQNAELKALVEKVAPAFQAHMMAAQQLQQKTGADSAHAGGKH